MAKGIKEILESTGKDIFTEDTLSQIEQAFNEAVETTVKDRVQLQMETFEKELDENHSALVDQLVKTLEQRREKDITAISESNAKDLQDVVKKYEKVIVETAVQHRDDIFTQIDAFLDAYLEEAVPTAQLKTIAENKYAQGLLKKASDVLGLNESVVSTEVREAILQGERQLTALKERNKKLETQVESYKGIGVLAEKLKGLPSDKRNYIEEKLMNKTPEFIERNFGYVSKQYDNAQNKSRDTVIEKANNISFDIPDRLVASPVTESAEGKEEEGSSSIYLEGLKGIG